MLTNQVWSVDAHVVADAYLGSNAAHQPIPKLGLPEHVIKHTD